VTPVEQLLKTHWQLAVEKVTPVGPVWRIEAVQGDFCLKRGKHSLARLDFDYYAIESLWKRGFTRTPRLIPTVCGQPFAQTEDGPFFLTKWVGRPLNPHSKAEWLGAAHTLGQFHRASEGVSFPAKTKRVYFAGKWVRRFSERTEELRLAFESLDHPQNEFEEAVKAEAEHILTQAALAEGALNRSGYQRLVREVELTPTLVHGNIKAENFSVDRQGAVFLIDFDGFRLDVPVQDLADLFRDVLPSLNWSPCDALDIFDAYHQARPVQAAEIPVLTALLAYPQSAYKEIHKYRTQPGRSLQKSLRKWRFAVNDIYRTHEFLQKWAILLQNRVQ
jgi:CotS family spore coat protein